MGPVGDAFEGGSKLVRPSVRSHFFGIFVRLRVRLWHFMRIFSRCGEAFLAFFEDFQSVWWGIFDIFWGFSVGVARPFWHFSRIFSRCGEAFLTFFEDFQSVWWGLFGTFRGFSVGWTRPFWLFLRIFSGCGEAFLALFEDFQSAGRGLFGTFWGSSVGGARPFWHNLRPKFLKPKVLQEFCVLCPMLSAKHNWDKIWNKLSLVSLPSFPPSLSGIQVNPTYKVWAGHQKFQIALTFLPFEPHRAWVPFWKQLAIPRRFVMAKVWFDDFGKFWD